MIEYATKDIPEGVVICGIRPAAKDAFDINLTIPKEINGKKVVSISSRSFLNPNGNDLYFQNRFDSEKVIFNTIAIPNGIGIDPMTFLGASVREIQLPRSITTIPKCCFAGSKIEKIVFEDPSAITRIEKEAFSDCSNLKTFIWPPNCRELSNCFAGSGLETLKGIENVEKIQEEAFVDTHLTELEWPQKCNCIPMGCFYDSTIEKITGIDNVTKIESHAFSKTHKLRAFAWPKGCSVIPAWCFSHSALKEISNIEHVEKIENSAFINSNLESFVWPSHCHEIPMSCFENTKLLKSIKGLEVVKTIGPLAFNSTSLKSICLGNDELEEVSIYASSFQFSKLDAIDMSNVANCIITVDCDFEWGGQIKVGFDTNILFEK